MTEEIKKLDLSIEVSKNYLRDVIKSEAKNIHIKDIMLASAFLREDAKFMPRSYREDYIKRFSKAFFTKIKEIKEDKNDYHGNVNHRDLKEFLELLDEQNEASEGINEKCFVRIARIIATYTTFVLEEPIHPVGTKFPGGFILHMKDGNYLCPVKNQQMKNPSALCRFCVSIQDETASNVKS